MPSSYTPLGVELMVTGEQAGLWGDKTNTNLNILSQIVGGYNSQAVNGTGDTPLNVSDGATGATVANRIIELTGTITGNITVSIPLDVENFYIIKNSTSGAFTVEFQYTSGSGTSVTFSATDKGTKFVYAKADDSTNPNIVDVFSEFSQINLVNRNELRFQDATGGQYVGLRAATTVGSSFTLNLPTADATSSGQALVSDSSGNLSFADTGGISTGKAIAMALIFG